MKQNYDLIIIGAGAAGLFCAAVAAQAGVSVLVLDHANKAGKKILMSGGGYCNFTNYHISSEQYLSHNPHFCKSALSQYSQWEFIALIERYGITYHEKKEGQLFCDNKASVVVDMLLNEAKAGGAEVVLKSKIKNIKKQNSIYEIQTQTQGFRSKSLVVATGGPSIPTLGASDYGYKIAEQFGLKVYEPRAGLVPFVLTDKSQQHMCNELAGSSFYAQVSTNNKSFSDDILFTHRGLSGPAILQISSYWQQGEALNIDMLPSFNLKDEFAALKINQPKLSLQKWLSSKLSQRFVSYLWEEMKIKEQQIANIPQTLLFQLADRINNWQIKPAGTEGYRTAEVALGGVDTDELSSKTMESKQHPGLYFIGEVVDVTGHLGGYNFQWAWSSAYACAQSVIVKHL